MSDVDEAEQDRLRYGPLPAFRDEMTESIADESFAHEIEADNAPTIPRPASPIGGSGGIVGDDSPVLPLPRPSQSPPVRKRDYFLSNMIELTAVPPSRHHGPTEREPSAGRIPTLPAELVGPQIAIARQVQPPSREQNGVRRLLCILASLVCSLGVVIAVFVLLFTLIGGGGNGSPTVDPPPLPTGSPSLRPTLPPELAQPSKQPSTPQPTLDSGPTSPPTAHPTPGARETAWIRSIQSRSPYTTFEDAMSPQRLALNFMLQDSLTTSLSDNRIIQRFALAVIYFATDGPARWFPQSLDNTGWAVTSMNECQWRGINYDVRCTRNVVEEVRLFRGNVAGSIPGEIGLLTSMTILDLYRNKISGTIPTEVGMLSALEYWSLARNSFKGSIPSTIGLMTSLTELTLASNDMKGPIPTEIGMLESLIAVSLHNATIEGPIPSEVGLLTSITKLHVWENKISGAIPTELGMLSALTGLTFANNSLTGTIPTEMGQMGGLDALSFSSNNMSSSIPTEIGLLTLLTSLAFHDNSGFSGSIPSELASLPLLKTLLLYGTQISGTIPSNMCGRVERIEIDCDGGIQCGCCRGPSTEFVPGPPCETAATP